MNWYPFAEVGKRVLTAEEMYERQMYLEYVEEAPEEVVTDGKDHSRDSEGVIRCDS